MIHGDPEAERWRHAQTRQELRDVRNTLAPVRLALALIREGVAISDAAFETLDEASDVTRTKAPKITPAEREVQKGVHELLTAMGVPHFRSNAGGGTRPKKGGGVYLIKAAPEGWPDITGMIPDDGRLLGLEIKAPGEWPSFAQIETMRRINKNGGVAFWVYDVAKCHATLRRIMDDNRIEMEPNGQWFIEPRGGR